MSLQARCIGCGLGRMYIDNKQIAVALEKGQAERVAAVLVGRFCRMHSAKGITPFGREVCISTLRGVKACKVIWCQHKAWTPEILISAVLWTESFGLMGKRGDWDCYLLSVPSWRDCVERFGNKSLRAKYGL